MLRKLVFKAAIICEGTKYCFNYAIQARDHKLDILEKQSVQQPGETFDILRSFSIIKIFLKEVKRSATQHEEQKETKAQAQPEKLDDWLEEVEKEVDNWRKSMSNDSGSHLNEIINALKAKLKKGEHKSAVLTAIQEFSEVFVNEDENQRRNSFNLIAKALLLYGTWRNDCSGDSDKTNFDEVFVG